MRCWTACIFWNKDTSNLLILAYETAFFSEEGDSMRNKGNIGGVEKILNEKCRSVRPTQNLFQTGYN